MSIHRLFEAEAITQNTSVESSSIELYDGRNDHGLQYVVTGAGTIDLTVYTSIDGQTWINNGIKADNITASTGPDSDGNDAIELHLKIGNHIKVKATEVDVGSVTLSLWMAQK